MKSRWPSDHCTASGLQRGGGLLAAVLLCSLLLSGEGIAHPDIGVQVRLLDAEIAARPGDVERLLRRGDLARREGRFDEANADFVRARELEPGRVEIDFLEGRLRLDRGDALAAERLFSRYLGRQPGHASAWAARGEARFAAGRMLAAAEDFGTAVRLAERPAPALYLAWASALQRAGEAHWEAALDAIDDGLGRFPTEVSLLGLGTDIALALGETQRGLRYLQVLPGSIRELPRWRDREMALAAAGSPNAAPRH